jgi:oligopeptide transport system ATP-binding protein
MTALLEVRDLGKSYAIGGGTLLAVDGVSLTVPRSGSVALVGESGSGKTTVARMVAGLEIPTTGSILVNGVAREIGKVGRRERKRRAREIQMVFQDPYSSLDARQTVGAAVSEVLREHWDFDRDARQGRVEELLNEVGLDAGHADSLPRQLSGGQRQRVAIARALAAQPSLLVLDEAVASLDVSVQAQVLNLLAELRERLDIAYLFISHDLGVVRQVSDECLVMERGRIVEQGETARVLDAPQDEYTQRLLDALPRPGWVPRQRATRSKVS